MGWSGAKGVGQGRGMGWSQGGGVRTGGCGGVKGDRKGKVGNGGCGGGTEPHLGPPAHAHTPAPLLTDTHL